MTKEEIKNRFDNETAILYGQRDPAWLPEFAYAFGLIPKLIQPFVSSRSNILDIGAGTGNLSRTVFEQFAKTDDIRLTLLDFSQNMLDQAPNILAPFTGMFDIVNADFMTYNFEKERYCAVVSSFAIHHCRGDEEYLSLYKRIFETLSKPGIFVCCDVVAGNTAFVSKLNEQGWIDFLKSKNFSETEITKIVSNYKIEDSPASLPKHIELLAKAGFDSTDIVWKKANFGIYIGIKSA